MNSPKSAIDAVVDAAARIQRHLHLGKLTESEAVSAVNARVRDRLTDRFGMEVVGELPEAGRQAAAEFEEPLLQASLRHALRGWIPRCLGDELRHATPAQRELIDRVSDELRVATEAAVTAAVESGAGSAADYTRLIDTGLSEGLVRRVSEAFPLTPQSPSSSDEMRLTNAVLTSLVCDGRYAEAVGEVATLHTAAQRAAATAGIVHSHFRDPRTPDPLPDLVVVLVHATDWSGAPGHLDSVASTMLRCHRDLVPGFLGRWAADTATRRDDGRPYRRAASSIAWVAGDQDLALSIALRDAAPLGGRVVADVNPAADYVLGQLASDVEERVDRLLRFAHQVHGEVFQRALMDAAGALLAGGEPVEAACLFTLSNWFDGARGLPGVGGVDAPGFMEGFKVDDDERVILLQALQSAGVPGTIRFDGLRFDGPSDEIGSYYCPGSAAALRRGVARGQCAMGIARPAATAAPYSAVSREGE